MFCVQACITASQPSYQQSWPSLSSLLLPSPVSPSSLLSRCKVRRPPLLSSSPSSHPRPLLPRSLLRPSHSRPSLLRPSFLRPPVLWPALLRPPLLRSSLLLPPFTRAPHLRQTITRTPTPGSLERPSTCELRKSALHVGPGGGIVHTMRIHWCWFYRLAASTVRFLHW